MNWAFLNVDEIFYQIHLFVSTFILKPLWYVFSFQWVRDSSASQKLESGEGFGSASEDGFFSSGIARIFNSRPSTPKNSVEELLNPTAEQSNWQYFLDIFFGTSDQESVFAVLFGSVFGWVLILGLAAIWMWWYYEHKIHHLDHKERKAFELAYQNHETTTSNDKATRWQTIIDTVGSEQPNDWKVAVMNADILLDEILVEQGYSGTGVADKLKQMGQDHDGAAQYAWEGHKIRNLVAHDAAYVLSQREARMAISMYERFFNQFYHT